MKLLRLIPALAALAFTTTTAAAQAQTAMAEHPRCIWSCYRVLLPYGLQIHEVTDGGSFVTLEDGSVYEIRLPQRPVASSWQPGDFVQLKNVGAPVDRFEILLARGDTDRAEARLAGRKRLPAQE
jgi:hypothetical protein